MKLVEYKDYRIVISDEAFLVKPIRELYEADTSAGKEYFLEQMSYLYFMVDPRSTYSYITDLEERAKAIIAQEGLAPTFSPSPQLLEAMEWYKKHTITTSTLLLEDTRLAIDKLRKFLRDIDLSALDDKGKPIYQPSTIATTIKQIPQLAKDLMETEKIVEKEIQEQGRARGGNQKHLFEDGVRRK